MFDFPTSTPNGDKMTPLERAEQLIRKAERSQLRESEREEFEKLSIDCIRAVIEASKEENWDKPLYSGAGMGNALFKSNFAHRFVVNGSSQNHGYEFFQRVLNPAP